MESIQRYWKRTDKTDLLLCILSSSFAVLALSSWAAKQGSGFALDDVTGQIVGIGDYRRAVVQAGAAAIGLCVAVLLSNIDYRSLVKVWPVHVAVTWGMVLPTLFIRIFNQDAELVAAAVPALHIYFFGFVMMAFQYSGQSTFRALGRAKYAVFFSLLRKAFIVVPLTLLLPYCWNLGVSGVFAAEPVSNCIGGLACYFTMRHVVMPELKMEN